MTDNLHPHIISTNSRLHDIPAGIKRRLARLLATRSHQPDLFQRSDNDLKDIGLTRGTVARRGPSSHWDLPPGSYFHR